MEMRGQILKVVKQENVNYLNMFVDLKKVHGGKIYIKLSNIFGSQVKFQLFYYVFVLM